MGEAGAARRPTKRSIAQSRRNPTPLDFEIGKRIREARRAAGATQEQLAAALGTTFQQVQKYEAGRNRVAASRLVEIAEFLKVAPMWLLLGERAEV
jgi:transcriptional regulator with XRE-family HTH domain